MKNPITFLISSDLDEKFRIALQLNQDNADDILERLIMQYISTSFSKASQAYRAVPKEISNRQNLDTGKANNRIRLWASKPYQNNHKIIKAFFRVEGETGLVKLESLEKMCSDEGKHPDTYVRDFRGNFAQMKIDAPKSHGKVFEVADGIVTIWPKVNNTLMEYKSHFK